MRSHLHMPFALQKIHSGFYILLTLNISIKQKTCHMSDRFFCVPVTLLSGLNSGFSRADSKIDSISSFFLCDCEVVCLHILICYGEVFIAIFFKHGAVCIKRDVDVGVSEYLLQNLCGHTRFDAPCRISMSE